MDTSNLEEIIGDLNDKEKKNAPTVIYSEGDLPLLRRPIISIIGSRKATPNGLKRARSLARKLSEKGIVVLSGLAEGIDTAAHTGAIDAGGKTIGVLGTPIDQFYPKENRSLQQLMMKEQLVLTQFASGDKVTRSNFPIRNNLMALLSRATVIVEASDNSGSLYQATEAIRLGRPLYFLRSNLDNSNLTWPAMLQALGAKVLTENGIDDLTIKLQA